MQGGTLRGRCQLCPVVADPMEKFAQTRITFTHRDAHNALAGSRNDHVKIENDGGNGLHVQTPEAGNRQEGGSG